MMLLGILGVFLLVPLELIKSIIRERQKNSENVKKEIAYQWAGEQTLTGPVLNIPVWIYPSGIDPEPVKNIIHIMPETLRIKGDIKTEKRHISIYKAVVYNADLHFSGEFVIPDMSIYEKREIRWNDSYFTLGISDNRGLKGSVVFITDSIRHEAIPALKDTDLFATGITFPADVYNENDSISFTLNLKLSGSESISFSPVGKTTEVNVESEWISPGFKGNFLPAERIVNESGFNASWVITYLNRNFPQTWAGKSFVPSADSFGVDFIMPVDHYQKSERSAKYGILLIALTFLTLLFVEMRISERIHIFHYLLVSLALVLFFSLLNALSEDIGFNLAYLISSLSTIGLITFFLKPIIIEIRPLILISGVLIFLYSFIFILLTLNDYAYLAGNIGLFVLLAVTMRLSVKLNLFRRE